MQLNNSNQGEYTVWDEIIGRRREFQGDPVACEHLVYRFLRQYLPALYKAETEEARQRVWTALWSYLTSPRTKAKTFSLSASSADELIGEIQREVARRR